MNVELEKAFRLMRAAGLPRWWADAVIELAHESEGVAELVESWCTAETDEDRQDCIELLQGCLDDREPPAVPSKLITSHRQLDAEVVEHRAYKARLRAIVESHGGVSEVARRADMPQPSLSRLLTGGGDPRRSTLQRLADAMEVDIAQLLSTAHDVPRPQPAQRQSARPLPAASAFSPVRPLRYRKRTVGGSRNRRVTA